MLVSPVNPNTTVKFARFEVNSITGTKVSMLSGLDDVNIVSPANNDVLTYNATTNKWTATAGGSGGGISSGKAIAMTLVFG
jgi:chorismate synthase